MWNNMSQNYIHNLLSVCIINDVGIPYMGKVKPLDHELLAHSYLR